MLIHEEVQVPQEGAAARFPSRRLAGRGGWGGPTLAQFGRDPLSSRARLARVSWLRGVL